LRQSGCKTAQIPLLSFGSLFPKRNASKIRSAWARSFLKESTHASFRLRFALGFDCYQSEANVSYEVKDFMGDKNLVFKAALEPQENMGLNHAWVEKSQTQNVAYAESAISTRPLCQN
jgi:hypothetical protein